MYHGLCRATRSSALGFYDFFFLRSCLHVASHRLLKINPENPMTCQKTSFEWRKSTRKNSLSGFTIKSITNYIVTRSTFRTLTKRDFNHARRYEITSKVCAEKPPETSCIHARRRPACFTSPTSLKAPVGCDRDVPASVLASISTSYPCTRDHANSRSRCPSRNEHLDVNPTHVPTFERRNVTSSCAHF